MPLFVVLKACQGLAAVQSSRNWKVCVIMEPACTSDLYSNSSCTKRGFFVLQAAFENKNGLLTLRSRQQVKSENPKNKPFMRAVSPSWNDRFQEPPPPPTSASMADRIIGTKNVFVMHYWNKKRFCNVTNQCSKKNYLANFCNTGTFLQKQSTLA